MRKNEAIWIESRQRWQINVQYNGERKTFTSSIPFRPGKKIQPGKIEAEKKADQWLEKGHETDPRFDRAWDAFLADKKANTGTANHNKVESLGRLWLAPRIKHKKLSTIKSQDWQDCINDAGQDGKSKRTCGNIRALISSFVRFSKKNKWKLESPEYLTIPTNAPVGKRNVLQTADLKVLFSDNLINRYGKQDSAFFIHAWRFIVLLGLRRGELAGLKNTDLVDGVLHIQRSVNSLGEVTTGKNENAERCIKLSKSALQVLEDQQQLLKSHYIVTKWLFPGEDGDVLNTNTLYKRWRVYAQQHGIKANLHELRHTFISAVKADMPEQLLKSMVGHSVNMDTFGVYGHEFDGDMERAAEIVDIVFKKLM